MNWSWRKRRPPEEGAEALERAREDLERTLSRWEEVIEVSVALRKLRERNHFAEQLTLVMKGRPRGGRDS